MSRRIVHSAVAAALLVMSLGAASASAAATESYVVVLEAGTADVRAVAADLARAHGGQVGFVYEHALQGFSVTLAPRAAAALARNPQVAYVAEDMERSISAQEVPTGIERIFADDNANIGIDGIDDERIDVDVAVIDTGVDFEHPDLNVVGGVDCSGRGPFNASCSSGGDDDHYHGTHVAGTIAALDNDQGVVGVAPGARIWSVKVLNQNGSGYTSWIVAGIDWVAGNAATIEVANMSLGGSGFNQAEYDAIQGAVDAGVAFAVAAGNSDDDAANYSPAAFDNVLTVSALADFDGAPGGNGSPTCRNDQDDTLADFSNWGDAVQIAAPGVCILSTFPIEEGSYGTISGTSMASPHAAGALALLASVDKPGSAAEVHHLYDTVIGAGNFNWVDDSGDGTQEPLLDVSDTGLFDPATVPGDGDGGDENQPPTASFDYSCDGLDCSFTDTSSDDGGIVSWSWSFGDGSGSTDQHPTHTYAADGTYTVELTVTDGEGATDTASEAVVVSDSDGGDGEGTLTGTSQNNGRTWTAVATLSGPEGTSTSGTWDLDGSADGCTIASGQTSCTFDLAEIPKRVSSVTYTDSNDPALTVTIVKS